MPGGACLDGAAWRAERNRRISPVLPGPLLLRLESIGCGRWRSASGVADRACLAAGRSADHGEYEFGIAIARKRRSGCRRAGVAEGRRTGPAGEICEPCGAGSCGTSAILARSGERGRGAELG